MRRLSAFMFRAFSTFIYPIGTILHVLTDELCAKLEQHTPSVLQTFLHPLNIVVRTVLFAPNPILTPAERKVCIILAELFLDTDTSPFNDINARRLLDLRPDVSLEQVRFLMSNDVFPIFVVNLLEVAGEWAYFEDEFVVGVIERRRRNLFAVVWRFVYVPGMWVCYGSEFQGWRALVRRYEVLESQENEDEDGVEQDERTGLIENGAENEGL